MKGSGKFFLRIWCRVRFISEECVLEEKGKGKEKNLGVIRYSFLSKPSMYEVLWQS